MDSSDRGRDNAPGVTTFALAADPEVTIGAETGEAPYLLSGVADATRQSDGTIVVADCLSGELRWFDRTGRFLRKAGGRGEGPGEFGFLRRIFRLGGDTLAAYGPLTIVAPDGRILRTVPLRIPVTAHTRDPIGGLSDGSFVVRRGFLDRSARDAEPYRGTMTIFRVDSAGAPIDSLTGLPAGDYLPFNGRFVGLRLSRAAVFAVEGDRIFYGGQDEAGIVVFDATLNRVETVTQITRAEPVTDEARLAFQAMLDAGTLVPPRAFGPVLGEGYAPMMPAFGDMVAGRDGKLWVEDPFRPGHHPLIWTAYEDGDAVARVEIPPRFFPFEFGSDWILGVSYDELDVERVQLWRIVPGTLPGVVLPPRDAEPPTLSRCGSWTSR